MKNPFDDIRALILGIAAHEPQVVPSSDAYGRMAELGHWYVRFTRHAKPQVQKPLLVIFAANHGIAAHERDQFPAQYTAKMVEDISNGNALINQTCQVNGIGLQVFELAIEKPTADITTTPALNEAEWAATFAYGMECMASEPDLLAIGSISDGGILSAAAIYAAVFGGDVMHYVPRFADDDDQKFAQRCQLVESALAQHKAELDSPLKILQIMGGREITAIAGAIIAARYQKTPVVLDGFVSTAAAAILHAISPAAISHCQLGHISPWGAHQNVMKILNLQPILDLGLTNDIGIGATITAGIVKSSMALVNSI